MATGLLGQGSSLAYSTDDFASSDVEIVNVTSVTGPTTSVDSIETTNLSSTLGYRSYIQGLVTPGELTIACNLDPSATSHQALFTYLEDQAATVLHWKLLFTDATFIKFQGVVTGAEVSNPIDGAITLSVTIQITGNVDWPGSA